MSQLRQILVHIGDSAHAGPLVKMAHRIARLHGATLQVIYAVEPSPIITSLSPADTTLAVQVSQQIDTARRSRAAALIGTLRHETGDSLPLFSSQGDPLSAVLSHTRHVDLLVMGQYDPNQPDGTTAGFAGKVVVGAACPVLIVPYAMPNEHGASLASTPVPLGHRALIAWSPSRECARAIRDALPLLTRAGAVEVVRFGDDNPDELQPVLSYLKAHQIEATAKAMPHRSPSIDERLFKMGSPDASVAEALLSHAADFDADLIVMGGYGHTRAWEFALGGVTKTLLQTMTVPVLMAH